MQLRSGNAGPEYSSATSGAPNRNSTAAENDSRGAGTMPSFISRASFLAGGVLVGLAGVVPSGQAAAQHKASVPDFYGSGVGWYGVGDFIAVPGGPRPVDSNPAYPYVPNGPGRQATDRLSD